MFKLTLLAALITISSVAYGAPATTCIKTTIKPNGHTTDRSIVESSGNRSSDLYALNLVKIFSIKLKRGEKLEQKTGFVLVETYEGGGFGMSLIEYKGKLLDSCKLPNSSDSGT